MYLGWLGIDRLIWKSAPSDWETKAGACSDHGLDVGTLRQIDQIFARA